MHLMRIALDGVLRQETDRRRDDGGEDRCNSIGFLLRDIGFDYAKITRFFRRSNSLSILDSAKHKLPA